MLGKVVSSVGIMRDSGGNVVVSIAVVVVGTSVSVEESVDIACSVVVIVASVELPCSVETSEGGDVVVASVSVISSWVVPSISDSSVVLVKTASVEIIVDESMITDRWWLRSQ